MLTPIYSVAFPSSRVIYTSYTIQFVQVTYLDEDKDRDKIVIRINMVVSRYGGW